MNVKKNSNFIKYAVTLFLVVGVISVAALIFSISKSQINGELTYADRVHVYHITRISNPDEFYRQQRQRIINAVVYGALAFIVFIRVKKMYQKG